MKINKKLTEAEEAQAKADALYLDIEDHLKRLKVPAKDIRRMMGLVANYGEAELKAQSYCEDEVERGDE